MRTISPETIQDSILLTKRLIGLADEALVECEDDSCLLLCFIIIDSAYSIRQALDRYMGSVSMVESGSS